ncbi:hypothetical protein ACIQZG_23735 [Lysinibacillus sp. NPDC096418]|uniref:hypothetical protein n=1 Tax=Lysinibacillus sp. NPDC096418 TaxID=3364138 RepID=UPI0037FF370B
MESLTINERIYKINFIPFEDKCGLNEDGTYDNIYRGKRIKFHYNEEILHAMIYGDTKHRISFGSSLFTFFGEDLEKVKEYFREKHGITEFKYYDLDKDYYLFF